MFYFYLKIFRGRSIWMYLNCHSFRQICYKHSDHISMCGEKEKASEQILNFTFIKNVKITGFWINWRKQTVNLVRTERRKLCFSVLPQLYGLLFDALLGDDANFKRIPSVHVPLCCWDEDIFDQLNCLLLSQRNLLHTIHVLETNLRKNKQLFRHLFKKKNNVQSHLYLFLQVSLTWLSSNGCSMALADPPAL